MATALKQAPRSHTRAKLRNQQDLIDAMSFFGISVPELAEVCGKRQYAHTISHLRYGTRDTCSIHLGRRIEKALRVHPGALFVPSVSTSSLVATTPTRGRRAA